MLIIFDMVVNPLHLFEIETMSALQSEPAAGFSLRDHNRAEKRQRIREAAREVFCTRGYVDATTREIAAKARIANGTLFRYAADKRELLMMIVNDDLDVLHAAKPGASHQKLQRGLRAHILDYYRPRYEYFARYPLLSRPFVREAFNFMAVKNAEVGPEARRNRDRRKEVISDLIKIVKAEREPRSSSPPLELAANFVHAIYLSACREWLESTAPDARAGLESLDSLLKIAMSGLDNRGKKVELSRQRARGKVKQADASKAG
jgi:AcrR family transcriptional regulator